MDLQTKKRLYNLCNPDEALAPGDARYVDVDALGVRGSWTEALATRIELSDRPIMERVTASRGAGLTTELRRLAARLADASGAHLLPVLIDGAEVVSLAEPIDLPDVLLPVVARTEAAVSAAEGVPATTSALRRFAKWLPSSEHIVSELSGVDDGGLSLILLDSAAARAELRLRAGADLTRFVAAVREELTLLHERARRLGYQGIVVLFDSLTRLRGYTSNWSEVIAGAERLFGMYASYLEVPVHAVYTVPPALFTRLDAPLLFLPMIALRSRDGRRDEAAHAAAREIVRRRVPDEVLDELFGYMTREARVDLLIEGSAGAPREVARLLQSFIARGATDPSLFSREISTALEVYRRLIWASDLPLLARVHATKALSPANAAQRDAAERLLANGAVLRYAGHGDWFDVHPAVEPLLDAP